MIATGLFEKVVVGPHEADVDAFGRVVIAAPSELASEVDEHSGGSVIVKPEFMARHCFGEPMITVLTLGFIPYPGCYVSGYRFALTGLTPDPLIVDDQSSPLTLWGWIAGPIRGLPEWSAELPVERERELLRDAIVAAIAGTE